jgi:hypothetical protein
MAESKSPSSRAQANQLAADDSSRVRSPGGLLPPGGLLRKLATYASMMASKNLGAIFALMWLVFVGVGARLIIFGERLVDALRNLIGFERESEAPKAP